MITLGIDEVGRGSLAGPLLVAAVIIDNNNVKYKDSKRLSAKARAELSDIILSSSLFYGFGWVSNVEIDELGLTKALILAIKRSMVSLKINVDEIIIDGNINYLKDHPQAKAIIRADSLVPAVSAASIIAKVARDQYMIKLSKTNNLYQFEQNKGYGTRTHIELIKLHGYSIDHRRSFQIKTWPKV